MFRAIGSIGVAFLIATTAMGVGRAGATPTVQVYGSSSLIPGGTQNFSVSGSGMASGATTDGMGSASASSATGVLLASAGLQNVGTYTNAFANANATITDALYFYGTQPGQSVTLYGHVAGTFTGGDDTFYPEAVVSMTIGASTVSKYYRPTRCFTADTQVCQIGSSFDQAFSVTILLPDSPSTVTPVNVAMTVRSEGIWAGSPIAIHGGSGSFTLDLMLASPYPMTFTSESGSFLTSAPEPTGLSLLMTGVAALTLRRHYRRRLSPDVPENIRF